MKLIAFSLIIVLSLGLVFGGLRNSDGSVRSVEDIVSPVVSFFDKVSVVGNKAVDLLFSADDGNVTVPDDSAEEFDLLYKPFQNLLYPGSVAYKYLYQIDIKTDGDYISCYCLKLSFSEDNNALYLVVQYVNPTQVPWDCPLWGWFFLSKFGCLFSVEKWSTQSSGFPIRAYKNLTLTTLTLADIGGHYTP